MSDAKSYSLSKKRVFVAGHRGMVGSAIVRRLESENCEIVVAPRRNVDLRRQEDIEAWMKAVRPDAVFLAAARVGGIYANDTLPAEFLYDNLLIEANLVEAARRTDVEKLLFLGSSCIYPKWAPQPIGEGALLTGPLEPTNEWYAIAKIAGIKLCQAYRRQYGCDFISLMPTNLYGPGDNFDPALSHVVPALMVKAHRARIDNASLIEIWGTGSPKREFLHVDDLADAAVHLMKSYSGETHVNVGSGRDLTIADLASLICDVVGFQGALKFDLSKPDGTPRKLLDIGRITALGWQPSVSLKDGLAATYAWYLDNIAEVRQRDRIEA